jgi:hypothetical protein
MFRRIALPYFIVLAACGGANDMTTTDEAWLTAATGDAGPCSE